MNLTERINADFIIAFKAKDMEKKTFLGLIKSEIKNNEGRGIEATDENALKVIKKMEKSLKETNTAESLAELRFIEGYLPTMMTEEDIASALHVFMSTANVNEMNIGGVMKHFNSEFRGKADNKVVSKLAREILA